jgi:hypothetical protein
MRIAQQSADRMPANLFMIVVNIQSNVERRNATDRTPAILSPEKIDVLLGRDAVLGESGRAGGVFHAPSLIDDDWHMSVSGGNGGVFEWRVLDEFRHGRDGNDFGNPEYISVLIGVLPLGETNGRVHLKGEWIGNAFTARESAGTAAHRRAFRGVKIAEIWSPSPSLYI